MNTVSIVDHSGSRKCPAGSGIARFPAHRPVKLGSVDSRNVSVGVVLAMCDRWGIELHDGVALLRRSEARNLRRALFGSRGTQIVPRGKGRMAFELFDGTLYLDYESPPAGCTGASYVRVRVVKRSAVQ
jgi:hypothetical protein